MHRFEASPTMFRPLVLLLAIILAGCSSNIDLNQPQSQLDFGVRAAENDLWREARFRFERAVEMNPSDAMARNNLAVAYEGAGEFEKAREAYVAALKLDQANPYIQKNYSRFMEFYSRNRKREAEAVKSPEPPADEADEAAGEPGTTLPTPTSAAPPGQEPAVPATDTPPRGEEPPSPPGATPAAPPQPNGGLR